MVETDIIKYFRGIFQGDGLSLLLLILSVNPLSFLLNTIEGYKIGNPGEKDLDISHMFFVDDLKLLSSTAENSYKQLDIVTMFSKDIGMSFGQEKCAYIHAERGKKKSLGESLTLNNIVIKELNEGDRCTYLGIDESAGMDEELTKRKSTDGIPAKSKENLTE